MAGIGTSTPGGGKPKRPWSAGSPGWGFPDEESQPEAVPVEPITSEPPYIPAGVEPPAPSPAMGALDMMMAPPAPGGPNEQYGFDPETPLDAPMGMRAIPASSRALAELIASRGGRAY